METKAAKQTNEESPHVCRRREEILDAATRLFAEEGFSNADTQMLADRLGVGKGTLYRYFPSKRELFLAAADRVMQGLQQRVVASIQDEDDPLERLRLRVRAFLDYFAANPDFVELLIQERAQFKDRDQPTFLKFRQRNLERWRETYRVLIAQGRIRDMSVERITDVMATAIYGAMFLTYFAGGSDSYATQAEDILDVVFFGILSDAERARQRPRRGVVGDSSPKTARSRGGSGFSSPQ